MGVLDFLFEGKPPKSVTTYGQTVQNVPTWLSDYTQGMIARANAVAAEPYQSYTGPRIAGFSPTQQAAFDMTVGNIGASQPYIGQAISQTQNLPGQGALNQAMGTLDTSGALTMGAIAPGQGGAAAAQPYMDQAAQTFTGANVGQYMDPYIENVINRAGTLAGRQFNEKILPGIQDTFTGAGQYGSSRMKEVTDRAARDMAEGLQEQAQAALSGAYTTAGNLFGADQQRQGALAQLAGQLGTAGQTAQLQAGQQMGQLGQLFGALGLDTSKLGLQQAQQLGALGESLQGLNLRDAAALEAIGGQEQQLAQRNLDLAYQDFVNQRDYPRQQVDWLSQIIRGLPATAVPTSGTTTSTGPSSVYQPSPLAQIAALASGIKGISSLNDSGG